MPSKLSTCSSFRTRRMSPGQLILSGAMSLACNWSPSGKCRRIIICRNQITTIESFKPFEKALFYFIQFKTVIVMFIPKTRQVVCWNSQFHLNSETVGKHFSIDNWNSRLNEMHHWSSVQCVTKMLYFSIWLYLDNNMFGGAICHNEKFQKGCYLHRLIWEFK